MEKYNFSNDYSEGCHPNILTALTQSNLEQQAAYGQDEYSLKAKQLIYKHLGQAESDSDRSEIVFVSGGTQANLIVTAASLRPHEAIISANTGHIANREAGAIEATGHKIISMPSDNGKLTVDLIQQALDQHADGPSMVKPKMVYLSNATETGMIYYKSELQTISQLCRDNNLYLFIDGARLGSALVAEKNDVSLKDLAELSDAFWIGGTKAGALLGEAIVLNHPALIEDFMFHIKQRGAMLAKGRLLGIQFYELFKNDLIFELSTTANRLAKKISQAFIDKGYEFSAETMTNQLFPILPNAKIEQLAEKFSFYIWKPQGDNHSIIRLVTSWATDEAQVDAFIGLL